ncbi:MAG: nuclease-related domain-containing protein [Pseudomonadales bacterium]
MDIADTLMAQIQLLWLLPVAFIVLMLFRSLRSRGRQDDKAVNRILSQLPETDYQLIGDVTLPLNDQRIQIDHIVVSPFGVFVIEAINRKGGISGEPKQAQWTQHKGRREHPFPNPLRQSFQQIKALEAVLGSAKGLMPVVVFIGKSEFSSPMPDNVIMGSGLIKTICAQNYLMFSDAQMGDIIRAIESARLASGKASVSQLRYGQQLEATSRRRKRLLALALVCMAFGFLVWLVVKQASMPVPDDAGVETRYGDLISSITPAAKSEVKPGANTVWAPEVSNSELRSARRACNQYVSQLLEDDTARLHTKKNQACAEYERLKQEN